MANNSKPVACEKIGVVPVKVEQDPINIIRKFAVPIFIAGIEQQGINKPPNSACEEFFIRAVAFSYDSLES